MSFGTSSAVEAATRASSGPPIHPGGSTLDFRRVYSIALSFPMTASQGSEGLFEISVSQSAFLYKTSTFNLLN